jgi:drug/metabolite transporter (DMT)-like permease
VRGRTLGLTALALLGFAANSVLCRLALRETAISPASFIAIRIASGAVALGFLAFGSRRGGTRGGSWASALALFVYAVGFSYAYITLSTATGALLLFGAVQISMLAWGLRAGERFAPPQVAGAVLAAAGMLLLLLPGWVTPSLGGGALMLAAGAAWGAYSVRGKGSARPLADTAGNFVRAVPMAVVLLVLAAMVFDGARVDARGAMLAAASGALASGVGYAIWYAALPSLPITIAATAQLAVPLLAAAGGALVVGEGVPLRLMLPAIAILGGLALVFLGRTQTR